MKIKVGDRVRYKLYNEWYEGEVTIVREEYKEAKVLFDADCDLNYWYYPLDKLEVVEKKK